MEEWKTPSYWHIKLYSFQCYIFKIVLRLMKLIKVVDTFYMLNVFKTV